MSYQYDAKYTFTETWFDPMIPTWENAFTQLKEIGTTFTNVLEIGCFEGRATIFICDTIIEKGGNYTVVDTFGGTLVESGMENAKKLLDDNTNAIYDTFSHNIGFFSDDINFTIHRGYSQTVLPTLSGKYDLIYVDASHRADDTFVDGYYANKLLNVGGVIIFDDFGWKDQHKPHVVDSPELGIRQFFTMYDNLYEPFFTGYQIGAMKVR